MNIPFIDFRFDNDLRSEILNSISDVIDSKSYVLGENVSHFENEYSKINNIKYTIGVSSGLDALIISLKALNIGEGDEVIVASNAYVASWLSISRVGAKIVPVEPDPNTFNIDTNKIEDKITNKTKAIMPVHLYGQPCDMDKIEFIAKKYSLYIVEDNAQSHLAKFNSKNTGTFGLINATSFYPTKNLGAIGEAGCITTNDKSLRDFVIKYRNYGSSQKYVNEILGSNSRLDEIQAAILNVKLKYLNDFNLKRINIANKYNSILSSLEFIKIPNIGNSCEHVYHLYVLKAGNRDRLQKYLREKGIGTSIHYPIPPHLQNAYKNLNFKRGDFPISEKLADETISIPIYPGLNDSEIEYVTDQIIKFYKN